MADRANSPPLGDWPSTTVAISQLSIYQVELTLSPTPIHLGESLHLYDNGLDKNTQTVVSRHGMYAPGLAINYVLLTDNEKVGDWRERRIDRSGGGELGGRKRRGELLGVIARESPAVVNIISAACTQPQLAAPFCLLYLLLRAFSILSNTKIDHPFKLHPLRITHRNFN